MNGKFGERIVVLGSSGSGKTVLARELNTAQICAYLSLS